MGPVPGAYFRSRVHVYHKDNEGVLHSLKEFDLSESILNAIARGERSINTLYFTPGDLTRLEEMGLGTASEVDIVVVFAWDARSLMSLVTRASDMQFRRRVLVMALERIRSKPSLIKILKFKGLADCSVRENPYLEPGHLPYENFIKFLLGVTDPDSPGGDKRYESFLACAADEVDETAFTSLEELGVRTVFHGTNHAVMDAILYSGLNPLCRRLNLQEDYFGVDYNTSLAYTRRKTIPGPARCNLLVFMIIVLPVSPSRASIPLIGAVTVQSNTCQLPLAEITL